MAVERTRTVSVRLSPAEHAVWLATARGDGRGQVGAWVRDRVAATLPAAAVTAAAVGMSAGTDGRSPWVISAPVPVVPAGTPPAEWAGLRAELGRVGNNLNQAVRLANGSGVNPARVVEMADAAERARVVMAGLLAAVRAATANRPVTEPRPVGARSLAEQVAAAAADRAAGRAAAGAAGQGRPR